MENSHPETRISPLKTGRDDDAQENTPYTMDDSGIPMVKIVPAVGTLLFYPCKRPWL